MGSSMHCEKFSSVISSDSFSPAKFSNDSSLQMRGDLALRSPAIIIIAGFSFLMLEIILSRFKKKLFVSGGV